MRETRWRHTVVSRQQCNFEVLTLGGGGILREIFPSPAFHPSRWMEDVPMYVCNTERGSGVPDLDKKEEVLVKWVLLKRRVGCVRSGDGSSSAYNNVVLV